MIWYQLGKRMNIRLGTAKQKLMSMGRVCTCGHTRAPRANCSPTRAMMRSASAACSMLTNKGEKVVGMVCFKDSSASWSTRAMFRSAS